MCDEKKLKTWAKDRLSRRQFGVAAGAASLAACMPAEQNSAEENSGSDAGLAGKAVSFETEDGTMDALFFAAAGGSAAPGVIHWPDIAGIRASHINMAQRTASDGYAVLLVNPYYRDAQGVIWPDFASFADGGWDRARAMRGKLSSDAIGRDAAAIVAWLDQQAEVDSARGIGAEGYCMGGPFTVYSAHSVPIRVKAAASFHGGGLVRDDAASPHRLLAETQTQYLFAIAKNDDAEAPDDKIVLREASDAAELTAVVEVFDGDHGWTVPDSPSYAEAAAEKAYAAKLSLYKSAL